MKKTPKGCVVALVVTLLSWVIGLALSLSPETMMIAVYFVVLGPILGVAMGGEYHVSNNR